MLAKLFQDLTSRIKGNQGSATPALDIWTYAESAEAQPDPLLRHVVHWRRLISAVSDPVPVFIGQPLEVIGVVDVETRSEPYLFTLARPVITCCLADTIQLGLLVHNSECLSFDPHSWLRIRGKWGSLCIDDQEQLVIQPEHIQTIVEPTKKYINVVF